MPGEVLYVKKKREGETILIVYVMTNGAWLEQIGHINWKRR